MKLAVVGATGLVGREIIKVLEEKQIEISEFYPVASERSKDKVIIYQNKEYKCITPDDLLTKDIDIAIFSAGSKVSEI